MIKNTGKFELNHKLDELPMVDRELTKAHLYNKESNMKLRPFAYTMVGRDCPYHKCRFCSWTTLFPKFRTRSPECLLEEIGHLIKNYKVKEIFDDTGTFPPGEWLETFCKGMIEKGYNKKIMFSCNMRVDYINKGNVSLMKQAGFRLLKVGLESANQKTLDRLNKGIKVKQIKQACKLASKAGLEIHLTMIIGYPWETKNQALNTYKLTKELMVKGYVHVFQVTTIIPYPGTPLYKECLEKKWFRFSLEPDEVEKGLCKRCGLKVYKDKYGYFCSPTNEKYMTGHYSQFDMSQSIMKNYPPKVTSKIVKKIYKLYFHPIVVLRFIFLNLKYPLYLIRGLGAVFSHLKDFGRAKSRGF